MANGENGKSPTWQWMAGITVSVIILFAGAMMAETRSEIKESRSIITINSARLTALERGNELQFQAIKEWREEMKAGVEKLTSTLDSHERSTASLMRAKNWNAPENRTMKGRE
jgi:hypothetical protein